MVNIVYMSMTPNPLCVLLFSPMYVDTHQKSNFVYKIEYILKNLSKTTLDEFVLLRNDAIEDSIYKESRGYHDNDEAIVDATAIGHFFDRLHLQFDREKDPNQHAEQLYTIFIVNPPEHTSPYRYATSKNSPFGSNAFVGTGRWIVKDEKASENKYSGGFSSSMMAAISRRHGSPAEISRFCQSAIQKLFTPDIQTINIPIATKVLIPIFVFQNHNLWNPWGEGEKGPYKDAPIDFNEIEREVSKMFLWPYQSYEMMTAHHGLHEHKQISIALYNSIRTRTKVEKVDNRISAVQRERYLDSETLRHGLSSARDILGTIHNLKEENGMRVLPVYVFSLAGIEENLFLEDYQLVTSTKDSVVVLQTNETGVPVPYRVNDMPIIINPMTRVERNIIAGIATSLGGLVPPISDVHKMGKDYTFGYGFHPFGYFSDTNVISRIFTDTITRNQVIAKTDQLISRTYKLLETLRSFTIRYRLMSSKHIDMSSGHDLLFWVDTFDQLFGERPNFRAFVDNVRGDVLVLLKNLMRINGHIEKYEIEKAMRLTTTFDQHISTIEKRFIDTLMLLDLEFHCVHLNRNLGHATILSVLIALVVMFSLIVTLIIQYIPERSSKDMKKKTAPVMSTHDATSYAETSYDTQHNFIQRRKVDNSNYFFSKMD